MIIANCDKMDDGASSHDSLEDLLHALDSDNEVNGLTGGTGGSDDDDDAVRCQKQVKLKRGNVVDVRTSSKARLGDVGESGSGGARGGLGDDENTCGLSETSHTRTDSEGFDSNDELATCAGKFSDLQNSVRETSDGSLAEARSQDPEDMTTVENNEDVHATHQRKNRENSVCYQVEDDIINQFLDKSTDTVRIFLRIRYLWINLLV